MRRSIVRTAMFAVAVVVSGCATPPATTVADVGTTTRDAGTDAARVDAPVDASACPVARCGAACVDTTTDPDHCGNCGMTCSVPAHASATCAASTCGHVCDAGYSDEGGTCVATPRPIAPVSTGTVTSRRPTFRWELASGVDDTTIDLCTDRACTTTIASGHVVSGTTYVPSADLPVGVVFWRLHPGTSSTTSSPVWELTVGARSAPVDTSWGTTLDVNGDGYADLAVGAGDVVYLYLGSASGLDTTPPSTLTGPDGLGGYFGSALASAGDVNGDGYADLVVGAWGAALHTGRAYVYVGSASGLPMIPTTSLAAADGIDFGSAVASAGDVNGDGYADVAIGAYGARVGGRAYVYLGSASGLATTPATTLSGSDGAFGALVASAGDVNGDGYADLVVTEPAVSGLTGAAYVYLGGGSGLGTTPATSLTGPDGTGGFFGGSVLGSVAVASAGDVNGDGYADLAVGAADALEPMGRAYVYFGSAAGIGATPTTTLGAPDASGTSCCHFGVSVASGTDVNGDGYADLMVGAYGHAYVYYGDVLGLAATPTTSLTDPDASGGRFGNSVASAGDVNGDGFADLAVGAAFVPGLLSTGRVHIYLGDATGLGTSPATSLTGPPSGGPTFGASLY